MFSEKIEFLKRAIKRATPQVRRPAMIGTGVFVCLGVLVVLGLSNTANPLSMPSALGGIAVSQAIWGLKPSNLLMVLPIGSFLVVLARSFIGLKAFGLFTPMLIALAFLQIGPIFGPIVMICAIGSGMIVAPSLLKLRMTRVGFLGVLISLVVFILAALQGILDTELQVDAFPVVVTALCVERWWRQWEKDGWFESARLAANTLVLALVIQFVMVSHFALMLIDVSPLLLPGFAAVAIAVLGRYRGLRMTEIGRFLPIWYEGWKRRAGLPVAEAQPEPEALELNEILAARAAIDTGDDEDVGKVKLTVFPSRPPAIGKPLSLTNLAQEPAAARPDLMPAPSSAPTPATPPVAAPPVPAPQPEVEPDTELLPAFARALQPIIPRTAAPAGDAPKRLTSVDWAQVRAELNLRSQGPANAQPTVVPEAPLAPDREPVPGGLSAFFTGRAGQGPLVDPALLGFLRPDRRHPGDQPAQRGDREVQFATGDQAGARQGGGQGGARGARGGNLWDDSRHLRLWTA